MATIGKHGKIIFSEDDIQFIKDNFQSMTNQQIADALGLKKTIVRTKAYELGLQKMKLEKWPVEAIDFLKENYTVIGNTEIVEIFNKRFPKEKGWTTSHIDKKLEQLKLKRNKRHWYDILERNRQRGSFGNPNTKKKPKEIFSTIQFKGKKYLLEPGQTKQQLFELIITNQVKEYEQTN